MNWPTSASPLPNLGDFLRWPDGGQLGNNPQVLINAVTVHVGTGTNLSGFLTNQARLHLWAETREGLFPHYPSSVILAVGGVFTPLLATAIKIA